MDCSGKYLVVAQNETRGTGETLPGLREGISLHEETPRPKLGLVDSTQGPTQFVQCVILLPLSHN